MTTEIKTTIDINASSEQVWKVLTNFEKYSNWNPFIKSIRGKLAVGNRIIVRIEPPEANGMTFKPKVLVYETNKEIRWLGHLVFPGLFDGEHKLELIGNENGTTTFNQSEKFSGILVFLFQKMLDKNTKNGFVLMNQKLKELAEKK